MALLLSLAPTMALAADMRTWLEPHSGHITLGGTLLLHVEIKGKIRVLQPLNLHSLTADFDIGNASGQSHMINGMVTAHWKIPMQPKRVGQLQIPALAYGPLRSKPLEITVRPPPSDYRRNGRGPVLARLEARLERERSPVEAQLVYAVRLTYEGKFALERSRPPPFPDDTQVRELGQRSGRNSDGEQYIEQRYALFPQRSGTLQLSPPTALIRDQHQNRILMLAANAVQTEIIPRPADTELWLPAQSVEISDQWGIDDPSIKVGDSLSRNLVLSAEGLLAEQLPELPIPEVDGLRQYPEPDQLDTSANPHSVVGQRRHRRELIPIKAGRLVVPEIRLPWWNVESGQWQEAVVPERVLWVSATDASRDEEQEAVAGNATLPADIAPAPERNTEIPPWQREVPSRGGSAAWPIVAIASCALMALFAALWLCELRRQRRLQWFSLQLHRRRGDHERQRLARLRDACEHNTAQEAYDALRAWGAHHQEWGGGTLLGLRRHNAALDTALDALERHLYAADDTLGAPTWQGEQLWQAVASLRHTEPAKNSGRASAWTLPELYPANQR